MNMPWKSSSEVSTRTRPQMGLLRPDFEDMVDRFFGVTRNGGAQLDWAPSVDLKEDEKEITLTCDVPGVDPKAIDISISGQTLTVKGERKSERVEDKANYYFAERTFGSFLRTIELPQPIDSEHVVAEQKDGVLTIKLKKVQSAVTKKIPIAVGRA